MTKTQAWVKAFRLRTLPLSLSGIIFGSFYAYYQDKFDWLIFSLAIATTLFLQILSNLANDLGDSLKGADNEDRVGPTRAVQSGLISLKEMKLAVVLFSLFSICTAIPLITLGCTELPSQILFTYIGLAIACVVAAITYTVGKKAYGYSGFGDVFVFIFFGLVSTLGIYTLLAKSFDVLLIFPAVSIGLLSVAVLNLNNLRDHENDKNVGKRTLVVKLGFNKAKIYHYVLITLSFSYFALFSILLKEYFLLLNLLPFILLFGHLKKVNKTTIPKLLDPELKKVALSTFIICLISSIIFIIL